MYTRSKDPKIQEALERRAELIKAKGMLPPNSAGQLPTVLNGNTHHPDHRAWAERNLRCAHDEAEWREYLAAHSGSETV